jgi:hypothetical protein
MYFGYQELGYLSLNVAAYPLLSRGLQSSTLRMNVGSTLAGIGAALHGFGLLSLAGCSIAALASPHPRVTRLWYAMTTLAWGTAAYAGWIVIYAIVLKLPVVAGHAEAIPLRPWLVDQFVADEDRVNAAILSLRGARDLLFTAWIVGAGLIPVAVSLARRFAEEVRKACGYAVPSVVFSVLFWPVQGLGFEMDLVVAAFPAFYAMAWVCAHDGRRSAIAAALLVSGHLAFWRVVLDPRFIN